MSKQPAFQFYPGDWLKDTSLRCCSAEARGIWIDLICMMFEAPQRGVLRTKNCQKFNAISIENLSESIAGCKVKYIQELIDKGVVRVARKDGALYSKRIIRDELHRRHKSSNGHKGLNKPKTNLKQNQNKTKTNTKTNSGSSSSTSTSVNINTTTTCVREDWQKSWQTICTNWNSFAEKKVNCDDMVTEQQVRRTLNDCVDGCTENYFLIAIENYRMALSLPETQAWKFNLHRFGAGGFRKFLPGAFDIDNFNRQNFEKGKSTETTGKIIEKLKMEGRL